MSPTRATRSDRPVLCSGGQRPKDGGKGAEQGYNSNVDK